MNLKFYSKILFVLTLLLLPISSINAFSYFSTETQKLDKSLAEESSTVYSQPTKIYVTQISTDSSSLSRNPSQWVKSLYYYCITRLHFADLPYTYLLDENGIIYQGRSGYVGANPELKNIDGAIVIGYLSNNPSLTARAVSSLNTMVEELSYNWGISKVRIVKLKIEQEEGKLATVIANDTNGEFVDSTRDALKYWKGYTTERINYKAKIEQVDAPEQTEIGKRVAVKVKMKNMNDFPWFTDVDPIYVSTKGSKESEFAINKLWDSFSKPVSISDKVVLPYESVEISFEMEARILIGEARERFNILKFENDPFEDSDFEVKFKIVKGSNQLVRVASSQYGFANIRECKRFSCKILESADNGAIFILLDEEDGWSKVRYGSETVGWVMSRYLKKI